MIWKKFIVFSRCVEIVIEREKGYLRFKLEIHKIKLPLPKMADLIYREE